MAARAGGDGITTGAPSRPALRDGLTYVVFFFSGFAGLAYEISWSRQIGLVVGHTASALALVLTAYFVGLALGQAGGTYAARRLRPLFAYGLAEIVATGGALLVPALTAAIASMPDVGASPGVGAAVRATLCLAVLLPATAALGATLPLMAAHLGGHGGRRVTLAYALNTAGGLAGVIVATLLLAPVGVRATGSVAAGLSAACGIVACGSAVARRGGRAPVDPRGPADERHRATHAGRDWPMFAAASGLCTLGLEVLYTRMFSLVFHNSTYTFGIVLAVFLAGLALGAAAVTVLGRRVAPRAIAIAGSVSGGVAAAGSVGLFVRLTGLEYFAAGGTFAGYLTGALALVAAVVLPPVTLLGMVLPAAFLAVRPGGTGAAVTGRFAAVNTLAAAAGSLAAGFGLTPFLGLWGSFAAFSVVACLTGAASLVRVGRPLTGCVIAALSLAAAGAVTTSPRQAPAEQSERRERVVRRWESTYGWIDVVRSSRDDSLKVRQNLHYRHGSTGSNAVREYRQGRLPLLLHERPAEVAFLGLGTGLTAAPAAADPAVEHAIVVELIPEVVEAARMLSTANFGVVDDPKVRVTVDDARHYLLRTRRRFDVVVADLYVPWESRTGYLYTAEHFAAVRRALKPGGLFCQWVALYQVGPADFELIADSFASEFPRTTLWWGQLNPRYPMVALIGSDRPIEIVASRLAARLDEQAAALGQDPFLDSSSDLSDLYLGRWPIRSGRRLNTDEHPWVEFTTPVSHRAERLLHGRALRDYFDAAFARLPSDGALFGEPPTPASPAQNRARQRLALFGDPGDGPRPAVRDPDPAAGPSRP